MSVRHLIPYRLRLWWAWRKTPVCHCANPGMMPSKHDPDCEVRKRYGQLA